MKEISALLFLSVCALTVLPLHAQRDEYFVPRFARQLQQSVAVSVTYPDTCPNAEWRVGPHE